jgi:NTP pyrophosphatase (non-canonical NTP hydrolase)
MENKLKKIINNYGTLNQVRKFNEECYELTEAIFDYEYTEDSDKNGKLKEHIAEELADVMVLLEQFKLYYGLTSEEITKIFWSKVDRQLERMRWEDDSYV